MNVGLSQPFDYYVYATNIFRCNFLGRWVYVFILDTDLGVGLMGRWSGKACNSMSNLLRSCQTLQTGCTFHQQCCYCSTSLKILLTLFLYTSHILVECEVVSPSAFDLHFSDGYWCQASFHTFRTIYLREISVQSLCLFLTLVIYIFII